MSKLGFDMLILRNPTEKTQTTGNGTVYVDQIKPIFDFKTMELEVDCNAVRDDAIPAGTYTVVKRYSAKYGWHFHITNVPNRSLILIHEANFSFQLLGCIGVGAKIVDINKDGLKDITSSRKTKKKLLDLMPDTFILKIVDHES
ncbi:MAG: hypothetical protein KUG64_10245 [Cycloclasticus sp.]|nr:hypothetical protein [Cycloclasticus sp.]